ARAAVEAGFDNCPVARATMFSRMSRIRLVRRSRRITSRSSTTRSQESGSRGRPRSRSGGRGSSRFCKPGGSWPFFSRCFCSPGGRFPPRLAKPGGSPLALPFFSLAIVVLDHAPFFGQKMRGAVRLERESHTAAAQNQSARRYGQLQKSPALVHVRCLRRSFKSGLLVMSFAVGGAVAVG